MPNPAGSDLILEKNKIVQSSAWVWLAQVEMSPTEVIRLAANNTDVTFLSETWTAFPFRVNDLTESNDGELPRFSVFCVDVTGGIKREVRKNNGLGDKKVTLFKVPSALLASPVDGSSRKNYLTWQSYVISTTYLNNGVSFQISSKPLIKVAGPRGKIVRGSCPYTFKDANTCQYSGAGTVCDKSLDGPQGCSFYDNVINYGGFPGVPKNV